MEETLRLDEDDLDFDDLIFSDPSKWKRPKKSPRVDVAEKKKKKKEDSDDLNSCYNDLFTSGKMKKVKRN